MEVFNENVIVEPIEVKSFIELPDEAARVATVKYSSFEGIVEGDKIVFSRYLCPPLEFELGKIHVVKGEDIIAKL